MFENVLSQASVVDQLSQSISTQTVPGSMLFEGIEFSGKTTTALEMSRVLTCAHSDAPWNCGCRSCRDQRLLVQNDTKLIGPGRFMPDILAAADVVTRMQSAASRYLFIRSIRKMLSRLEPELIDESNKKYRAVLGSVESLFEMLESISPVRDGDDEPIERRTVEQIVTTATKVVDAIPRDTVPVDQIRRLSRWAHTTTPGRSKIAILSNADRMGDSSRNALLKTLEEPPINTYFILTASSADALIPTIRSRLRPYRFKERSHTDDRAILQRIFRDDSGEYESLREYFLAWDVSPDIIKHQTVLFLDAVMSNRYDTFFSDNRDIETITRDKEVFLSFLSQLVIYVMTKMRNIDGTNERIESISQIGVWNQQIQSIVDGVQRFNITPGTALETLFYKLGKRRD